MLTLERFNEIRNAKFAATDANMAIIDRLNRLNATDEEIFALPYVKPFPRGFHELRQAAADIAKARKANGTTPATPARVNRTVAKAATPATPAPVKAAPQAAAVSADADALGKLAAALNGVLKAPALDEAAVRAIVAAEVDKAIKTAGAPRRIEVKTAQAVNPISGTVHERFEDVLNCVANNEAAYLYGPAGTGKTHMAAQIAEALGLDFHYSGQLSQVYEFTGFTDANGRFQPTPFYKAFTEGGLFFLDEMDRSFPEVLTKLNGALANGLFDFPAPIGVKKMHPNFRCMAAGNTIGRGATGVYTAANCLDASSLDRFTGKFEITYDSKIEDAIDKDAADFVRVMRKAAGLAGLDVILSYRAIKGLAKFVNIYGAAKTIKTVITATLSKDDINILRSDAKMQELATKGNKYAVAFAA